MDLIKDSQRHQNGESRSFEELFNTYHKKVYTLCLRMTGNAAEAEDLTQEVFVRLHYKLNTFRGESAFSTWLHRLTVNLVLMHFRKTRRKKEDLTEDGELPETPSHHESVNSFPVLDRLALDEAIVQLAPRYRAVFVLHDVQGLQHLEIAKVLGCSVGTSKSQLHKARLRLRKLLRQQVCSANVICEKATRSYRVVLNTAQVRHAD